MSHDTIDDFIIRNNLEIKIIDIHPELDTMVIYLNTKVALVRNISLYKLLKEGSAEQLSQYEIINGGTGIHWPLLDEHLSLRGFLQEELRKVVKI